MAHALVVEDDPDFAHMLARLVISNGFTASTAGNLREARQMLAMRPTDVVLLDVDLPDGSGILLFEEVELLARAGVVLVTGHASISSSVDAMRRGAADYLVKPLDQRRLTEVLARYASPTPDDSAATAGGRILGSSAVMEPVMARLTQVAPTSATVLLTGESGTGKEMAARAIHDLSHRRSAPFIAVNCAAISPQLLASELFGHERGSFTGAERAHAGFFERAEGGTLMLDEITEMPLSLQAALLRVLEEGTYMRVGALRGRVANVRVLAATNRVPLEAIASGVLREDLYWRLAGFPLHMPPLRDRLEDVGVLARHFVSGLNLRECSQKTLSDRAVEALGGYPWPGNVRELRNVVQQAWIMAPGTVIQAASLPPLVWPVPNLLIAGECKTLVGLTLAESERKLILDTLSECGRNRERAAAMLGISLKTLYNRLKLYGQP